MPGRPAVRLPSPATAPVPVRRSRPSGAVVRDHPWASVSFAWAMGALAVWLFQRQHRPERPQP